MRSIDIFKDYDSKFNIDDLEYYYKDMLLNQVLNIFKYENLPKTIPKEELEKILMLNGFGVFTIVNENYYIFKGGLYGFNEYQLPTNVVINNPYLKFNKDLKIDDDCIIIKNSYTYQGLYDLIKFTSYLLSQCDLTFKYQLINLRVPNILTATDDESKSSIKTFFEKLEKGEFEVIIDEDFEKYIKSLNYGATVTNITNSIELKQYIISWFYNQIGVQSQFNMKRESLNANEIALNDDILSINIDNMLECRQNAIEKINKKYNLNIKVSLNGLWLERKKLNDKLINEEVVTNE